LYILYKTNSYLNLITKLIVRSINTNNNKNKIPEDDHMMFCQHAIKIFNERFILYDFDEYLLAYYIHPGYKGTFKFI